MNYAQDIEQIEKKYISSCGSRDGMKMCEWLEDLLTLAKKMREEIKERDTEIKDLQYDVRKMAELKFGWIRCSERLPEKDDLYPITVEREDGTRWSTTVRYRIDDDGVEPERYWIYEPRSGKVIAWMPLPETYGGER